MKWEKLLLHEEVENIQKDCWTLKQDERERIGGKASEGKSIKGLAFFSNYFLKKQNGGERIW